MDLQRYGDEHILGLPNGPRISCGDFSTVHYPTFLRSEASASCMRLLGRSLWHEKLGPDVLVLWRTHPYPQAPDPYKVAVPNDQRCC